MSSPNRHPGTLFHPLPQRIKRAVWDEKLGKLVPCEPILQSGQLHNPERQVKKMLAGKYHLCRVEKADG